MSEIIDLIKDAVLRATAQIFKSCERDCGECDCCESGVEEEINNLFNKAVREKAEALIRSQPEIEKLMREKFEIAARVRTKSEAEIKAEQRSVNAELEARNCRSELVLLTAQLTEAWIEIEQLKQLTRHD